VQSRALRRSQTNGVTGREDPTETVAQQRNERAANVVTLKPRWFPRDRPTLHFHAHLHTYAGLLEMLEMLDTGCNVGLGPSHAEIESSSESYRG